MSTNIDDKKVETPIKRSVLDYDDIVAMVPKAAGHRKLINRLLHWLSVDKVNDVHDRYCDNPGPEFSRNLLKDFDINLRVDGREVLDSLPDGAFITVSNHPFGALDGISLIALMGTLRPDFKVMVNMVLNRISAMRPNFIAVDALASDDPAKQTVSKKGIMEAIRQVRSGHPLGFFPAGAVSKINRSLRIEDREWQPTIIRLVRQMGVPVVPIYFHGHNSALFNILGVISWQLRTLRLPTEVWRKCHSTIHISVGNIIPAEKIKEFGDNDKALGEFLKASTYELRKRK
ncbi:lysophospholipid acyltransferase family protein [Muribaculum intestinale]|jgi:putative hemolysin|uniref:lysophospholipid acyltransferase family protein n=1 Tax=Muribaculum intestinale TaxID=1796646 RepID=UPI00242A3FE8|nr:lysophospholipid acyltransferase family protein [Muribaculum intestinale]